MTERSAAQATRLYPAPSLSLRISEVHASLHAELRRRAPNPERGGLPVVIVNMVASIDGRASVDGSASAIGSPADRQVMNNLRSQVDAVMIGANTLRAEKYSMKLPELLLEKRRLRGQSSSPWLVIPTTTADLPPGNLISAPPSHTILLTPSALDLTSHALSDHIVTVAEDAASEDASPRPSASPAARPPEAFNLTRALRTLKSDYDIETLLVEGGPYLNGRLVEARLVDEIFLTVAPKLLGGAPRDIQTILQNQNPPSAPDARLLSVHVIGHELFLRYDLARPPH